MRRHLCRVVSSAILLTVCSLPGTAETLVPTISGNELTARIELPGGLTAELAITFEKVVGLTPDSLSLTATVVNPLDLSLVSRLLRQGLTLPVGFPVVIRIEPTPASALSFEGVYGMSLYTNVLTLGANSPLRLYRASNGGAFSDMTGFLQAGSVRAGGSGPGFSEFAIAVDTRRVDSVIPGKFDAVQNQLTANWSSIDPAVAADLQQRLNQARAAYGSGSLSAAIDGVSGFANEVKAQSGSAIPNVWRANGGPVNVAGLLRSAADTLKFSLVFKSNLTP